jgi:uncharacterized membrane protein
MGQREPRPASSARIELLISYGLRVGVGLGAAIMLLGLLQLARTGQTGYATVLSHGLSALLSYQAAGSPGHFPTSPLAVLSAALTGKPYAIIELGLLTLIGTPVLRVALSVLFFGAERDWLYVAITLVVLTVLIASFVLGG